MSKELEALERLYKCNDDDYTLGYQQHDYKLLQQALQRLESIDNANPNDALEVLNSNPVIREEMDYEDYYTINKALLKAQEQEKENARKDNLIKYYESIIREHQQILKIIKETKNIKVSFYENGSGKHYKLEFDRTRNQTITEEEFDLLKRWLG